MPALPPEERGSWTDFLRFLIKIVGLLAGIFLFGFLVFWLRHSTFAMR